MLKQKLNGRRPLFYLLVSRVPGHLDLFAIGFDNRVRSTFWSEATGWSSHWFQLPGGTTFDHTTRQISALARAAGTLDLFAIRSDDSVWTMFWPAA